MNSWKPNRRAFLGSSAGLCAAGLLNPYIFTAAAQQDAKPRSKNDRLGIGAIGMNNRGTTITKAALPHGDLVAIADVDRQVAEKARTQFGGKAELYEDYREMLQRPDVDAVLVGTPDHWHAAMTIDACRAGKHVFCEKPLSLTIDEGKAIVDAVEQTGQTVQVGTWRRSEGHFRLACEMVRQGRLGKIRRVTVILGANPEGGPFDNQEPPSHLNWDRWLGQTPWVPYCPERCHRTFRWWLEYSGGQMTDWGAHHIDIAQWGLGRDDSGPVQIDGKAKWPQIENGYNVPTWFEAKMVYDDGVELVVRDEGRSGIMFEGEKGRIFVNRGTVDGKPAEDLEHDPLPREQYQLYPHDNLSLAEQYGSGGATSAHMRNFFECVRTSNTPISDVASQHRTATVCHAATISMRLGRPLGWDPQAERFVDDPEANRMLSRPQREGYEIESI